VYLSDKKIMLASHTYQTYDIKDQKHILMSKIRVIDNLIPDYDSLLFRNKYNFSGLKDNYYDPTKIGEDDLYPELADIIRINANLSLKSIGCEGIKKIHAKVFLVSDKNSNFQAAKHIDDTAHLEHGYTLSYHAMGENNCGGTSFYENFHEETPLLQIPFKENRLVVFPAGIPHTGYTNHGYPYDSKRVIYTLFTVLDFPK
jgi:hypothetical protein